MPLLADGVGKKECVNSWEVMAKGEELWLDRTSFFIDCDRGEALIAARTVKVTFIPLQRFIS